MNCLELLKHNYVTRTAAISWKHPSDDYEQLHCSANSSSIAVRFLCQPLLRSANIDEEALFRKAMDTDPLLVSSITPATCPLHYYMRWKCCFRSVAVSRYAVKPRSCCLDDCRLSLELTVSSSLLLFLLLRLWLHHGRVGAKTLQWISLGATKRVIQSF